MIMDDKTIMIITLVVLAIAFTWGLKPIRQFVNQVTAASNKRTTEAAKLNHDAPQECNQTPTIPISVISHLVLPFIQDRRTWNNICSANKELYEAGMRMTPPWPETKLMMLGQMVGALEFSPCGSFLASGSGRAWSFPKRAYICDRRGKQTSLTGHTSCVSFLSFSNDGKYLASTGSSRDDASIRIYPTNATKLPQQSYKALRGHHSIITCLDFSPHDSNILASGDDGAIKLWNVEQEVCIYNFNHFCAPIRSLFFSAVNKGYNCTFVTATGLLILTCWDDLSRITTDIVDMPELGQVQRSAFSHCGSLLAAVSRDGHTITLYSMVTMTVVQRLSIPNHVEVEPYNFLAFSPDDKTLVFDSNDGHKIHICEVRDLNISRRLGQKDKRAATRTWDVAFDPSGQFLASAGPDQNVRLWTL